MGSDLYDGLHCICGTRGSQISDWWLLNYLWKQNYFWKEHKVESSIRWLFILFKQDGNVSSRRYI